MTLLAAVITSEGILLAADTREDRQTPRPGDDAPTEHRTVKFRPVPGLKSVAWGRAGGSTLAVDFRNWLSTQHPSKWDDLQGTAHQELVRLMRVEVTQNNRQEHDPTLDTRILFAGYLENGPRIHVSYSTGNKLDTEIENDVVFVGSGEASTRLARGILKELHPETTVNTSGGLRAFMRGCITANPELGGKAMVWRIPPGGTLTLVDESED